MAVKAAANVSHDDYAFQNFREPAHYCTHFYDAAYTAHHITIMMAQDAFFRYSHFVVGSFHEFL